MVKLLAFLTRGRELDPGLIHSFGRDFKPRSHDNFSGQLLTSTYSEEAGDYANPNDVLGQRDCLDFRPDIADIKCTSTNRCSISDSLLLQIFTVVELLFRDIKL